MASNSWSLQRKGVQPARQRWSRPSRSNTRDRVPQHLRHSQSGCHDRHTMQGPHPDSGLLRSHGSLGPSSSFSGSLHSSFSGDNPFHEAAALFGHPLHATSAVGPDLSRPSAPRESIQAALQLPSAGRQASARDPQIDAVRGSQASPHALRQHSTPHIQKSPSIDLRRSGSLQQIASPKQTPEPQAETPNSATHTHTHSRSSHSRAAQHASRRPSLPPYLQPQLPPAAGHSRSSGSFAMHDPLHPPFGQSQSAQVPRQTPSPRASRDALHQQPIHPFGQPRSAHAPRQTPSPHASRMAAQSAPGRPATSDFESRPQQNLSDHSAEGSAWDPMPASMAGREASPPNGAALEATTRMQAQAASSDLLGDHPDPEDPTGLLGFQQGARGRRKRQAGPTGDGPTDELAALLSQQSWLDAAAGQAATRAIQGCVCITAFISDVSLPHATV